MSNPPLPSKSAAPRGVFVLIKLVAAHNKKRWGRALLGVLGIAASVCLIAWVIRAYDAAAHGAPDPAGEAGRFDIVAAPPMPRMMPGSPRDKGGPRKPPPAPDAAAQFVDPRLVEQLRADPAVAGLAANVRTRVRVVSPPPAVELGPFGGGFLMGTADGAPPSPLSGGRWLEAGGEGEAVISTAFGERYALGLGDELTVGGTGGELRLRIVGLLPPGNAGRGLWFSPHLADIYVPIAAADTLNGFSGRWNAVNIALKPGESPDRFVEDWSARTAHWTPPVSFRSLRRQDGDPMGGVMLQMFKIEAQQDTVLAFLAAFFVIFSTLSGGLRERLREFASLRAIAMSRSQLVAVVFLEALLLALLGWGLGLLLAQALLGAGNKLAVFLRFFQAGVFENHPLSRLSVLVSGACALVGSAAAAAVLAWQAARLKPVDILSGPAQSQARGFPRIMVAVGAALVIANPIMVLLANTAPFSSFFAGTSSMGFGAPLLGSGAMIIGLALLTPGAVLLVEAVFGPLLAWILRLHRRFLRQQLTGNLWRTVWTTIALSAGLTLFVTELVWGYSMLVPYTPDKSLPRMLVSILPAGVPESAIGEVERVEGVVPGQCLAMAVEQPRLTEQTLASKPFESVDATQQHLLIMGVDPRRAFAGSAPVLGFTFLQGDRETAARKLAEGRYCLVPDHFHTQTGLGAGDKFSVEVPNAPGTSVEYEIAGVVSVPGWNWFTKFADIRRRSVRALAMVFADYGGVKADFKLDRIAYFWMNVDEKVSFPAMAERLEPLADRYAGVTIEVAGAGPALVSKQYVKITERADLIEKLNSRADSVIWQLTRFPLIALAIASLAVFNTIFGSVRARFWQFGILRGVGLSRGQLFRLVLSESLMIFAAAATLSLISGTLLAWCGIHICTYFFYFAGRTPPLVLPWGGLAVGFGIALALCLAAGLVPAWRAARKEPLGFIQAGRLSL
ncbi:MAG TPA: ABC transporter permease [Planctomycetota bacterium]|nr:ABC transporter permease [Planctomycetota bacterium]OQC19818.1 MAG: FtsX-like permease family protein [Planctomycetes bacterium ADurb.Bin069]HNS00116.1 ABC transporter permease [Planctomycetota bacterium]HNU26627.1 ABC transporter permease [Planctomycetota bacterium]HOE30194.1 ABC transporter permease [Planctomycetota bacterium]